MYSPTTFLSNPMSHDNVSSLLTRSDKELHPDPLYRLRLAVLKDDKGSSDCPIRMFIFWSQDSLQSAVYSLSRTFGGAFSEYRIEKEGVLEEEFKEGMKDRRTENILLKVDSQTADEKWEGFLHRLDVVRIGWTEQVGVW